VLDPVIIFEVAKVAGIPSYALVPFNILLAYNSYLSRKETARLRIELKAYIEGKTPMEFIKSPNYTKGRFFRKIKFVVVHSMAGNIDPSIRLFQTPERTSAHYLIGHNGRVVQMVDEGNTAYHTGSKPTLFGISIANMDSIGIEHEGGTFPDGHNEQLADDGYKASAQLIADIHKRHKLGEPSSVTMRAHRELKATACPSGLDMGKLIQMSQDAYNGREAVQVPVVEYDVVGVPVTPTVEFMPFVRDLKPSQERSDEVARMQKFLSKKGYLSIASDEYGYYGKKTQAAIDKFQKANGIPKASQYGWWYPKTREAANKQLT
jgi:N-acetyl-anhydromuramyl-L-alanine amidase AmpD